MPKTSRHSHQDYAHCTRLYKYAWTCSGVWAESPDCGAPLSMVLILQLVSSKGSCPKYQTANQCPPSVCLADWLYPGWVVVWLLLSMAMTYLSMCIFTQAHLLLLKMDIFISTFMNTKKWKYKVHLLETIFSCRLNMLCSIEYWLNIRAAW